MKIIKILGGLGNQMFQYALYLAIKNRYKDEETKIEDRKSVGRERV